MAGAVGQRRRLLRGGRRRTVALGLFNVDRGRLLGDRLLLAGRGPAAARAALSCRTRLPGAVAARVLLYPRPEIALPGEKSRRGALRSLALDDRADLDGQRAEGTA
jgi:hypothetical protein